MESHEYYESIQESFTQERFSFDELTKFLRHPDTVVKNIALNNFEKTVEEQQIPTIMAISNLMPILENPQINDHSLRIIINTTEKGPQDSDLFRSVLEILTNYPDTRIRSLTYEYLYFDTIPYKDKELKITNENIPTLISYIDKTLRNEKDEETKIKASIIFSNLVTYGVFKNPMEAVLSRISNDNIPEVNRALTHSMFNKLRENKSDKDLFKTFKDYEDIGIQTNLAIFLTSIAKDFLRSDKQAQEYIFNLIRNIEIPELLDLITYLTGKQFSSIDKKFIFSIHDRLEDNNNEIRELARYYVTKIIEDSQWRRENSVT